MSEIRTSSEFKLHPLLEKFLEIEGIVDENDKEIYGKIIETNNSFDEFKQFCFSYSKIEKRNYEKQNLTILRNFQGNKGDVRKNLFHINFGDNSQNLVIIY